MDRRRFVSIVAGGAAAPVVLSGLAQAANAAGQLSPLGPGDAPLCTAAEVQAAYGCLRAGQRIGRWTVVEILDPAHGEIPVVLATAAGEQFRVDVLRRDDGALGVANTAALSLYLCNQGEGRQATCEEHGLGAMALAQALEADGEVVPRLPLLTLRERSRRFPGGAFASLA